MKQRTTIRWIILAATWLALAAGGLAASTDDGFGRYEVILDRMPFGEIVVEEAPPPEPAPAGESFAKAFRMCSITKPEGREKGAETALIKLEQTNAAKPAAAKPASPAQRKASTYEERRQERREERLARVRAAQEQREQQAKSQPRLTGEALRQHLQEYNMEAIRQGLPALPVELTPDQDAQLVAEGVLAGPNGAPPGGVRRPPAAVNDLPAELRDVLMEELTEEELRILQNY